MKFELSDSEDTDCQDLLSVGKVVSRANVIAFEFFYQARRAGARL